MNVLAAAAQDGMPKGKGGEYERIYKKSNEFVCRV